MRSEIPKTYLAALLAVPIVLFLIVDTLPRFVFASCSYYVTCDPETFSVTASPQEIALNETSALEGFNAECPCSWTIESQPEPTSWKVEGGPDCTATLKPIGTYGEPGTVVVRCDSGQSCSETVSIETGISTFRVQGSIDGGSSWASDGLTINGKPGEYVDLALRVNMNATNNPSQGWSYSMKHDASSIVSGGGALDIVDVTTSGTHTETVQDGSVPDFEDTQIREDAQATALGFTQGVVIDYDSSAITLDPVLNFVTGGACYQLTVPNEGSYYATFSLTNDIGDGQPPIDSVIAQHGEDTYPHLRSFTLTVHSHSSYSAPPGDCTPTWVTVGDGIATPPVETITLAAHGEAHGVTRRLPPGVEPDDDSRDARITPDGRFVVFASEATDLIDDPNFTPPPDILQIYRLDRNDDTVIHVSKRVDGSVAMDDCFHPSISDDGKKITFSSFDPLDSQKDGQSLSDIYLRDLTAVGETRLLSVDPFSESAPGVASLIPSISGNGDFVLFTSQAGNLDPGTGATSITSVYRVISSGAQDAEFVSFDPGGVPFSGEAATGHVGGDDQPPLTRGEIRGSIVGDVLNRNGDAGMFQAWNDPFPEDAVFLRDFQPAPAQTIQASPTPNVDGFAIRPTISQDTSRLAFTFVDPNADPPIGNQQIHFEDIILDAGGNRIIDPNGGGVIGAGDDDSDMAMLSTDGQFITFTSAASNLVPNDTNGVRDVFFQDLGPGGVLRRESLDSDDSQVTGGDSLNSDLAIDTDPGLAFPTAVLVFESDATDLIVSDTNGKRDIFERTNDLETRPFVRGRANSDLAVDLSDAVFLLQFLFQGGPSPGCDDAADMNDSGNLNLTDAVVLLNSLFQGGGPLPPPSSCGTDPTPDRLDCESPPPDCLLAP